MEIHAPEGSVHSKRDFLVHVGIITIGVLIALLFEGITQWFHHRMIAGEARASIMQEMRDNKHEIDAVLARLPEFEKEQAELLEKVTAFSTRRTAVHELAWHFAGAGVRNSSWNTATATGALAYLSYAEVAQYASVYDLQRTFDQMQQHWIDTMTGIGIRDPSQVSNQELINWQQQIAAAQTQLRVAEQLGRNLTDQYAKALHRTE